MTQTLVLGGGLSGLASALLASSRGEEVTLLEADRVGGKSRRITLEGQTLDTGPAVHSFTNVWKTLLGRIGEQDPLEHLPWPGLGQHLFRGEKVEFPVRPGGSFYADWRRYVERQQGIDVAGLLTTPPRLTNPDFLRMSWGLARAHFPHFTARTYLESLNLPPLLLESVAIHALNAGIGSRYAPALYASLPALMCEEGLSVPRGGIFELIRVLKNLCFERGIRIEEGTPVSRVESGKVWAKRRFWNYDQLINSLDYSRFQALKGGPLSTRKRTCSGVALYATLEEPLPLPFSSVILPDHPHRLERDLLLAQATDQSMMFVNHYPPHTVYPENTRAVLSILMTAPADGRSYTLEDGWMRTQLSRLERVLGLPIRSVLRSSTLLDPQFYSSWGAGGGAIYGDARALWQAGPFHTPPHRLEGKVWQVGTSAHPGGGIPGVLGSALMVDTLIREGK